VAQLEAPALSAAKIQAMKLLAHVLSPNRTGVYDELLAFIRTGVFKIDDHGIPSPVKDWWLKVDMLLLEDMHEKWGVKADPEGKYGVAKKLRKLLHRKWNRSDYGWALADDDELIFEFEEFDEWRVAFEDKQQTRSDGVDGIGRFG
jgi:hypothetical protein